MTEQYVYCLNCRETVAFAGEPVTVRTRVGARARLVGTCERCGSEVSRFLPSEDGPTAHNVRVGATILRELQRASSLTGISQRAVVESILDEQLAVFVETKLNELEQAKLISRSELWRRERELARPVEQWKEPERERRADAPTVDKARRLLQTILGGK